MHSENPDPRVTKNCEYHLVNFRVIFPIVILGLILYSNVLHGEFVSDDYVVIVDNPAIKNIFNLSALGHAFNTRFIVGLTFAMNFAWGKFNVFGYHCVNIILHLINALLVYAMIFLTLATPVLKKDSRFTDPSLFSFFAALIFLCHPIQTQGVAFITQRAVELGTLFYLSTLLTYVRFRLSGRKIYYGASLFCFLLGMFSKEIIFTVPFMLILYEFSFFDLKDMPVVKRMKMLFPYFLLMCLLPITLLSDRAGSVWEFKNQMAQHHWNWWYFLTEINVLRTYLRLLFLPINQTHEYDYALVRNAWEPGVLLSIAVLAVILIFACRQFRKNRLLSFSILWFFITTSVEVVVVTIVNRAVIYEHWLYLPMVGFAVFITLIFYLFFMDKNVFKRVMMGIVILLSILTYQRNFVWQNEIAFWEDGKRKTPVLPHVYLGAGSAYQVKKLYAQAYSNYSQAIQFYDHSEAGMARLTPLAREFYARIHSNLGVVCFLLFKDNEVSENFQQAFKLDSKNGKIYNNWGIIYFQWGKYQEAVEIFKKSLMLQGDYPQGYRYLGLSYLKLSQPETAKQYFKKARDLFQQYREDERVKEIEKLLATL